MNAQELVEQLRVQAQLDEYEGGFTFTLLRLAADRIEKLRLHVLHDLKVDRPSVRAILNGTDAAKKETGTR